MRQHRIPTAHAVSGRDQARSSFSSCDWPPPAYAAADGFSVVSSRTVTGPGVGEFTDATYADRLETQCSSVTLTYRQGFQGDFRRLKAFTARSGPIYLYYGKLWTGDRRTLPFYPRGNEIVVLHNSHASLDDATCTK
jgi:hypothetical protein